LSLTAAAKDFVPKLPHAQSLDFFTFIGKAVDAQIRTR
jgi:hypothetical protein